MVNFKKVMSVVLAAALVVSMSIVAFAATGINSKENTVVVYAEDGELLVSYDAHIYDDAENAAALTNDVNGTAVAYGKTVYIPFVDSKGAVVKDANAVSALKLAAKWDHNGKYIDSVEIVKKEGAYMIAIKTTGSEKSEKDVEGTIHISGKAYAATDTDAKKVKVSKTDIDVTLTLGFEEVNSGDNYTVTKDGRLFKFGDNRDTDMGDEEFEFDFEEFEDVTFTVDTTHQNDLVMKADDKENEAIEKANPNANMDFYNFYGATFRKTGRLFIPAAKDSFVYEVVNGELVEVNAVYDTYDEGVYITTKTLGNYIVSDIALVNAPIESAPTTVSVVTDGVTVSNPSTGASL